MPSSFYAAKSINLQSISYNVSKSTMSSNTAQNGRAFKRNLSSVTALCSWLLVMLKWHLELYLQFEVSTHNVITVSAEIEEECQKKKNQLWKRKDHILTCYWGCQTMSWDSFSLNWLRCKGLAVLNKREPQQIIIKHWWQTSRSGVVVLLL